MRLKFGRSIQNKYLYTSPIPIHHNIRRYGQETMHPIPKHISTHRRQYSINHENTTNNKADSTATEGRLKTTFPYTGHR